MHDLSRSYRPLFIALAAACLMEASHASPRIELLGGLESRPRQVTGQAQAISADGSVVVGFGALSGTHVHYPELMRLAAFRWTRATGIRPLAFLPRGGHLAGAEAISADGTVIVGSSDDLAADGDYVPMRATRWGADNVPQALPPLAEEWASSATGVTGDGRVIVGYSATADLQRRAVRWSGDAAPRNLGTLGGHGAYAAAVSRDGRYIVGAAHNAAGQTRAFVWNESDGMRDIGALPGQSGAKATAISANGNVVVGSCAASLKLTHGETPEADAGAAVKGFVWNRASGAMQEVVNTLGGNITLPAAVSADGSEVYGVAYDAHRRRHVFRWSRENGMRIAAAAPNGLRMALMQSMSDDGRYLVGQLETGQAYRAEWR